MTASPASQRKTAWWLAALLLGHVVLMSSLAKHPESEQSLLGTWIMTPLTFVGRIANGALSSVTGFFAGYVDLRGARAENIELREKNDQLLGEVNDLRERTAELDRVRRELALPPHAEYHSLAANVVARDTSTWFRRLTIDRGTLSGVRLNLPVMTAGGIVGRVISVGPNYATVQVITDKQAGVGAMLQNSRAMGEVRGLDGANCELKNISTAINVNEGESVVTTGLDRIYPKGLLIGTVERIEQDPNAPFNKIVIKPTAPIDRLEHVLVLLVEAKDLKLDETTK